MTAVMPAGVATARDLVGPALTTAVGRLSPDVRTVAAYHLGLSPLPAWQRLSPHRATGTSRVAAERRSGPH